MNRFYVIGFLFGLLSACGIVAWEDGGNNCMNPNRHGAGSAKSVVLTRGQNGSGNPAALGNQVTENVSDVWTVQFNVLPKGINQLPSSMSPTLTYAIIKWSIDGNDIQRIVTVGNGVSVAGVGEGATIQVYDATNASPGEPYPQYTVTATISPGTRGSQVNPPTFYPSLKDGLTSISGYGQLQEDGNPGDEVAVPVPFNAGVTSLQVTVGSPTGSVNPPVVLVIVHDAAGNSLNIFDPYVYTDFVPLNPSAANIQIVNLSSTIKPYYSVAYGIDG